MRNGICKWQMMFRKQADPTILSNRLTFAYSKTVPSLVSTRLRLQFWRRHATMDQFAYMGDQGINAATEYENGTPQQVPIRCSLLYGCQGSGSYRSSSWENVFPLFWMVLMCNVISRAGIWMSVILCTKTQILSPLAYGTNDLVRNINFGKKQRW